MSDRTLEHSVNDDRQRVIEEMITTVGIYFKTFDDGMPVRALSCKYGNRFKRFGAGADFPGTRVQLAKDGSFQIVMHRSSGSQKVFPWFVDLTEYLQANPEERVIRP